MLIVGYDLNLYYLDIYTHIVVSNTDTGQHVTVGKISYRSIPCRITHLCI